MFRTDGIFLYVLPCASLVEITRSMLEKIKVGNIGRILLVDFTQLDVDGYWVHGYLFACFKIAE